MTDRIIPNWLKRDRAHYFAYGLCVGLAIGLVVLVVVL